MPKERDSTVIRFVREVWSTKVDSWERFNGRVRAALVICAEGFAWEPGDLDRLYIAFREIDRCFGPEDLYVSAVQASNLSYCLEYERCCQREPIIADNVRHAPWWGTIARQRDRICVGSQFQWNGEQVSVTSFNAAGLAVACSYHVEKIHHRYTISAADVKRERKERRNKSC